MRAAGREDSTAAVVLAAGAGHRFTGEEPKLLTPFRGQPLVRWAVVAAAEAALAATIVVVGSDAAEVRAALPDGVDVVVNADWATGQASSLRAAIDRARGLGHAAVVVGLGDQPLVSVEAWRRVGAYHERPIGVATYEGQRRNPVRLDAEVWPLVPADGDEGMRSVMRLRPELVGEVPCPGQGVDIDTLEDLERWS